MSQERDQLRKETLTQRDQLSETYRIDASQRICNTLIQLPEFQEANTIAFYKAMRSEVDLQEAMEYAWSKGKKVALPRVLSMDGQMDFYEVAPDTELIQGSCGAYEPPAVEDKKVKVDQLQLILVPGAVVDRDGYRLGYGGGFYDRLFATAPTQLLRIGIAFDEQVVPTIHPESHDEPVHFILTQTEKITGRAYE